MKLQGSVHKYGDNVDTDVIIPARYLTTYDAAALARHCMEPLDPAFPGRVKPGDIMVGGSNFGCGSSREHAVLALRGSGIACVIAKSYARIFYRNCINQGLPILVCPEASDFIADGATVTVEPETGTIMVGGRTFRAEELPDFVMQIVEAGGLVNHVRRRLGVSSTVS